MSFQRAAGLVGSLLLILSFAVSAQAKKYTINGADSGGQVQIGGGLPLPIQGTDPAATGTVFPNLLVPGINGATLSQPTAFGALTPAKKIIMKGPVLLKMADLLVQPVFGQNPALYAVATNLGFSWPIASTGSPVTLSTGARTTVVGSKFFGPGAGGMNIQYDALASHFGGAARFKINPATGAPGQVIPGASVTIYGIAVPGPGNPPCTHTALAGPNAACVAALAVAVPGTVAAPGGTANVAVFTPGGLGTAVPPKPNAPGLGIVKAGANGTISIFASIPGSGFTNKATSSGFPWTVNKITVSAPAALGAAEVWTITGQDNRTAGGAGVIQMVSGSLSARTLSMDNANRGWLRLSMKAVNDSPALSVSGQVVVAALLLLAGGFVMRRRIFSSGGAAA